MNAEMNTEWVLLQYAKVSLTDWFRREKISLDTKILEKGD